MSKSLRFLHTRYIVIALAVCMYAPLLFLGYGSDVDALRVVDAGRNFMRTADYVPSRKPGFVVHEMITYLLDQVGGSFLSNLGTLLVTAAGVYALYRLMKYYRLPLVGWSLVLLVVHPVWWANSTCSMDYLWAIGFLLVGFWKLTEKRYLFAGLAFGLAIGSRLSSALDVGILLVYWWFSRKKTGEKFLSRRWSLGSSALRQSCCRLILSSGT